VVLGLFPDCELQKVAAVGNAAGDGTRLALLDEEERRRNEPRVEKLRDGNTTDP
jgi:uncharacterized 2Fe-2S/4Fe-4S cluster protein (DUF4445 family)